MFKKLENLKKRYNEINEILTEPEVINNPNKIKELSKEQNEIREIALKYEEFEKIEEEIKNTKEIINDPELKEIAEEEIKALEEKKVKVEQELKNMLLPKDPNDEKNVIMEIRGAAGGDEANLFAGDLYQMYHNYALDQGWKIEIINATPSAIGGFSQIEFKIIGKGVYSKLKHESGAHRVQRVPETESQGRVHTSTATVLVMPEVEEIDIHIDENDLVIDTYRSSGAGGQSVNTTDSAVRITHIPTGVVVTSQNERSQIANRKTAMNILRARLYEEELRKQQEKISAERKSKLGTGDRSEKIRTYNFPQNRVTDHRIGLTLNQLDRIMEGKLDPIVEALMEQEQKEKLEHYYNEKC
ncbi:MAG TPA: peptide chain release factor 1 [Tenericutes bacterium]|nr:peptide chain release factor 1 [Mycoplasmatota bacterium]